MTDAHKLVAASIEISNQLEVLQYEFLFLKDLGDIEGMKRCLVELRAIKEQGTVAPQP
jgi:hypothetical protein